MLIKNPCYDSNPITHAINIAKRYSGEAATAEQKAWVIDQMVRALTYCPMVINLITTAKGDFIEVELMGESPAYVSISSDPAWDKGIPV